MTPYISYIFLGQLVVTGAAILVACLLLLRRIVRKDPIAQMEPDKQKIAAELHQEIQRLRGLRDRLVPDYADEAPERVVALPTAVAAAPAVAGEPSLGTVGAPAPVTPSAPSSPADLEAAEKRGEERGTSKSSAQILDLEAKLAAALASTPKVEAGASAVAPSSEENDKLRKAATEAEAQAAVLKEKVGALEKVLAEYQIFEEDFALVKKYKEENDRLRQQLAADEGAAPSPKVTEDDIASLFSDFGDLQGSAAPVAEAPSLEITAPPVSAPVAGVSSESPAASPESAEDLLARFTAELNSGAPAAPAPAPVPASAPAAAPDLSVAPPQGEPRMVADEETAEAVAETSGAGDDDLMAEFEKLLGEPKR